MTTRDALWLAVWMYLIAGAAFGLSLGWFLEANRDKIDREMARDKAGRLDGLTLSLVVLVSVLAWPFVLIFMNKDRTRL